VDQKLLLRVSAGKDRGTATSTSAARCDFFPPEVIEPPEHENVEAITA